MSAAIGVGLSALDLHWPPPLENLTNLIYSTGFDSIHLLCLASTLASYATSRTVE